MKTFHITEEALARRGFVLGAAAALLAPLPFAAHAKAAVPAEVWKDPDCGCCKEWVTHLEANGFKVKVNETGNTAARTKLGVDRKYGSCHTALIGGYAIEGHVPAREIQRLLKEKPKAIGLAVPGMPVGSPGMDGPIYGDRKDAFSVMLLSKDGGATVYEQYPAGVYAQAAATAKAGFTEAEVRKVDKENKKVTLKHGEIKNLDMPAMTMVFQLNDGAALDRLKAGDKVRFKAASEGGKYTVTEIQAAK